MLRKIGREDLAGTSPFLNSGVNVEQPFRWTVFAGYEIKELQDGSVYIESSASEVVRTYDPLTETPHLFLEYARIAEASDPIHALLDWIHEYGLLGLTLYEHDFQNIFGPTQEGKRILHELVSPPMYYSPYGGRGETLTAYIMAVEQANQTLRLYESALNRDVVSLESLIFDNESSDSVNERLFYFIQDRIEGASATWLDGLVDAALRQVHEYISSVHAFCYPVITYDGSSSAEPLLKPDHFRAATIPRNLEGAMYLQMYWLITSSGELSRCENCGRILSLTRPNPEGRKRRNDRRFCNDSCRQAAHRQKRRDL